MEYTDATLVKLLVNNDSEDAFCELYIRYYKKLFLFCRSIVKTEDAAEDIIQEIFTSVWAFRHSLDSDMSFSSFLYTSTKNKSLNFLRQANQDLKIKNKILEASNQSIDSVMDTLIEKEYQEYLQLAISQLSPLRRKIFLLSRFEKKTHKEIASILNVSPYTVQENISAALKHIKQYLMHHTDLHFKMIIPALFFIL